MGLEEGLFHADDLDTTQLDVLRKYIRNQNRKRTTPERPRLKLYSRDAFVEKVSHVAIQAGASICAFSLGFDLSRIAVEYRVAHGAGKKGWSFVVFRYWIKKKAAGSRTPIVLAYSSDPKIPKPRSFASPVVIRISPFGAGDFSI